jgi:hypothetical protein
MSNLLSYLDENSQFQNFLQGKKELAQEVAAEKKGQIEGGLESLTLAGGPLLEKVGAGVKKAMDLYTKGSEAVSKFKAAGEKLDIAATKAEEEGGDLFSRIGGRVSSGIESRITGAVNDLRGVLKGRISSLDEISSNASSNVSKIGTNMSKRMQMNEFERDPESEIGALNENKGLVNSVRSIFRESGERATTTAQESMQGARGMVQEGAAEALKVGQETAAEIGSKASTMAAEVGSKAAEAVGEAAAEAVGEGVAGAVSEAIPVVGELAMVGMGIYDIFKGSHEKTPVQAMMARPVYNAGL